MLCPLLLFLLVFLLLCLLLVFLRLLLFRHLVDLFRVLQFLFLLPLLLFLLLLLMLLVLLLCYPCMFRALLMLLPLLLLPDLAVRERGNMMILPPVVGRDPDIAIVPPPRYLLPLNQVYHQTPGLGPRLWAMPSRIVSVP